MDVVTCRLDRGRAEANDLWRARSPEELGLFRYLHLSCRRELGDHPSAHLLTDGPLLLDGAPWGHAVVVARPDQGAPAARVEGARAWPR